MRFVVVACNYSTPNTSVIPEIIAKCIEKYPHPNSMRERLSSPEILQGWWLIINTELYYAGHGGWMAI